MAMIAGSASAGTGLAGALKTAFLAKCSIAIDGDLLNETSDAIADAVVNYIKSNADVVGVATAVSTTVAVASVSGVTPGPGISGPGAGTGSGAGTQTGTGSIV